MPRPKIAPYSITAAARIAEAVLDSADDAGETQFADAARKVLRALYGATMPDQIPEWPVVLEIYNEVCADDE